ncbi:MAG: hypothetical protein GXP48_09180, partial [Acidobacteria bacterium]|nr:hypothetical protein [Acidobacteriota bacterium]
MRAVQIVWLAMALFIVGCGAKGPIRRGARRIAMIHEAVTLEHTNPARAVALLDAAGPGAGLERFRLELWGETLRSIPAPATSWRRYIAAGLPRDLDQRAKVSLGRILLQQGQRDEAAAVLEDASAEGDLAADAELLKIPGAVQRRAARRMAVRDPAGLHRLDRSIEGTVLPRLTPAEWIGRAMAWRRTGRPLQGARELSRLRWHGGIERLRREELARCWLAAGRPGRALGILPRRARSTVKDLLLRARCELKLAWNLFPARASRAHFKRAADGAIRVASFSPASPREHIRALAIVLEARTEEGKLGLAWNAWVRLRAAGWSSSRRDWLGRRLGVAMARQARWTRRVVELERELPDQKRCLEFWTAVRRGVDREALRRLGAAPVADLYARWARKMLGLGRSNSPIGAPPAGVSAPPATVALLLRWGEAGAARREWRRLGRVQLTPP